MSATNCTCGGIDIGVGVMHEPGCGDDEPTPPDCAAHGDFMPNCGSMEGKDSCWACGKPRADHRHGEKEPTP